MYEWFLNFWHRKYCQNPKKNCVYHICGILYPICGSMLPHMWYTIPHVLYTIPQTWIPRKSLYLLLKEHSPPLVFERLIFKKEIVLSTKTMAIFNFDQFWTNVMVSFLYLKKSNIFLKVRFITLCMYMCMYTVADLRRRPEGAVAPLWERKTINKAFRRCQNYRLLFI